MKNDNSSCRICLKKKLDTFKIYTLFKQSYLPHIIYNISGVKILKSQEPDALICGLCAKACLVAHKIILRCQEADEYLDYIKTLNDNKLESAKNDDNGEEVLSDMEQYEFHVEFLNTDAPEMQHLELLDEVHQQTPCDDVNSDVQPVSGAAPCNKVNRVQPTKRRRNSLSKPPVFECKQCDFNTNIARQIIEHNAKVHQIHDTKIYACKYCPERFSWRPTLHRHIECEHNKTPEEKKYVCDICGKAYLLEKHLRSHVQEVHGPRLFKCVEPGCNQSFARAFTLRRHFLAAHSNTAKYHCKECNKDFKIYDMWKYHNDVVHKLHKVYCPRCGYAFRNKEKLEEHLANDVCRNCVIPCNYCQRKFTTSSGLLGHMRNIHKF